MKTNRSVFIKNLWSLNIFLGLLIILGCTSSSASWQEFETPPASDSWSILPAVWDNQKTGQNPDIRLILEPYCRSQECTTFVQKTVAWATALTNAHVRIYDIPFSQEGKSTLFSSIGRCIAVEGPTFYLTFLKSAQELSNAYDNNVEMQALSKSITGKYDTSCINQQAKTLQRTFENNPMGLKQVPAVWINGRIHYGVITPENGQKILDSLPHK